MVGRLLVGTQLLHDTPPLPLLPLIPALRDKRTILYILDLFLFYHPSRVSTSFSLFPLPRPPSFFSLHSRSSTGKMARKGRESRGEDTNPAFVKPKAWPVTVRYQRSPVYLPSSLASQSFPTRGLVRHPLPESSARSVVRIKAIDQPDHPAHGQYGLVATKDLKPGTLVLTYCGRVTRQDQVSPTSNYSLSFGPDLAIDAEKEGKRLPWRRGAS